jgi:hypothetical protein
VITCFECGGDAQHNHHVIPKSLGGTRTVPLCHTCHGMVHGLNFTNHGYLIKIGLSKTEKPLGRPRLPCPRLTPDQLAMSVRELARALGTSPTKAHRIIRANREWVDD